MAYRQYTETMSSSSDIDEDHKPIYINEELTSGEYPYVRHDPVTPEFNFDLYPGDLLPSGVCRPPPPCPGSLPGSGSTDSGIKVSSSATDSFAQMLSERLEPLMTKIDFLNETVTQMRSDIRRLEKARQCRHCYTRPSNNDVNEEYSKYDNLSIDQHQKRFSEMSSVSDSNYISMGTDLPAAGESLYMCMTGEESLARFTEDEDDMNTSLVRQSLYDCHSSTNDRNHLGDAAGQSPKTSILHGSRPSSFDKNDQSRSKLYELNADEKEKSFISSKCHTLPKSKNATISRNRKLRHTFPNKVLTTADDSLSSQTKAEENINLVASANEIPRYKERDDLKTNARLGQRSAGTIKTEQLSVRLPADADGAIISKGRRHSVPENIKRDVRSLARSFSKTIAENSPENSSEKDSGSATRRRSSWHTVPKDASLKVFDVLGVNCDSYSSNTLPRQRKQKHASRHQLNTDKQEGCEVSFEDEICQSLPADGRGLRITDSSRLVRYGACEDIASESGSCSDITLGDINTEATNRASIPRNTSATFKPLRCAMCNMVLAVDIKRVTDLLWADGIVPDSLYTRVTFSNVSAEESLLWEELINVMNDVPSDKGELGMEIIFNYLESRHPTLAPEMKRLYRTHGNQMKCLCKQPSFNI